MKLHRALVIGCLVPALASCTATSSISPEPGPTYTCCEAADINRDYQPGQTLTVHWIVVSGKRSAGSPSRQIELNARLTGPYATERDLKTAAGDGQDAPGISTFTAEAVRPSGQAGERPISLIPIPPTAAPGYYNLVTSVNELAGSVSGASVIHVVPQT